MPNQNNASYQCPILRYVRVCVGRRQPKANPKSQPNSNLFGTA